MRRTVSELDEAMTVDEFVRWVAYFDLEAKERKRAMDAARAEAGTKRKGRRR